MNYKIENNKIIITNLSQFNAQHILECGQIFRFKNYDNVYEVISGDEKAVITSEENKIEIECTNVEYFVNFFDLKTNYNYIKQQLAITPIMKKATEYGYGIRILRQVELEMFVSFIISANNNIKRIQGTINKLSQNFGTYVNKLGGYYAFPTLEQLSKVSQADWKELGAGYRAGYLVESISKLKDYNLTKLYNLNTKEKIKELTTFKGIGNKVADCILLFGYYDMNCFPVDTWIEKVYNDFFETNKKLKNRDIIRKKLVAKFDKLSGYAQQYLFYFRRENWQNFV